MNPLFSRLIRQDIIHLHTFYGRSVRGAVEKIAIYSASKSFGNFLLNISILLQKTFFLLEKKSSLRQRENEKYTIYVIDKHTI